MICSFNDDETVKRMTSRVFYWDRLHTSRMPDRYLLVAESPDTSMMKMLVDFYPDEEEVRRYQDCLIQEMDYLYGNDKTRKVKYSQKDFSVYAAETYMGSTSFGRAYAEGSVMARMPNKILNTIYKETHLQIDICSSYGTMLYNCFKDLDAPTMEMFVTDPERFYGELGHTTGLSRKDAKIVVNAIISSAPSFSGDYGFGPSASLDLLRYIGEHRLVRGLKRDVAIYAEAMKARYDGFYKTVRNKVLQGFDPDKIRHVDGVALTYLAGDMEHVVMGEVIKQLFDGKDHFKNIVWKFDGVLFPKTCTAGKIPERMEVEMSNVIKEKFGIQVKFKISQLGDSYGICLPDSEIGETDKYKIWKVKFEKRMVRVISPPVFMNFFESGRFQDLSKEGFKHVTLGQPKDMIQMWLDDPDAKVYTRRDFLPPPLECQPDVLNLYKGLHGYHLPPNIDPVDITSYHKHVDILVGNHNGEHPDYAVYLHKLIAFKIQKPGLKWGVMPFIRSPQGVGKDVFADFLCNKVFGQNVTIKDTGIDKFAGLNSHRLEGNLLCFFSEMGYKETMPHYNTLKSYITDETIQFQKKHVNSYKGTNVIDFIGFSNDFGALPVEAGERRFFVVTSSGARMQDPAYFEHLIKLFKSDSFARAVYDYYINLDVSTFNPAAERLNTEAHKEMSANNRMPIANFLSRSIKNWKEIGAAYDTHYATQDIVLGTSNRLRITSKRMLEDWMGFAEENNFQKANIKNSQVMFLTKEISQFNAVAERFKTSGFAKLIERDQIKINRQNVKVYYIDLDGIAAYMEHSFGDFYGDQYDQDQDDDQNGVEESKNEKHLYKVVHQLPTTRSPYLFVAKLRNEEVFGTNDLEEMNKFLGEAYVEQRGDKQFLINQFRKTEIELGEEYMGPHGKTKLEMKYPWYRKSRVT